MMFRDPDRRRPGAPGDAEDEPNASLEADPDIQGHRYDCRVGLVQPGGRGRGSITMRSQPRPSTLWKIPASCRSNRSGSADHDLRRYPVAAMLAADEHPDALVSGGHGGLVLLRPVGDTLSTHDFDILDAQEAEDGD